MTCWIGTFWKISINTVWYCWVLLLLAFQTSTDSGIKRHECALVSLLWEYDADPPGAKFIWIHLKTSKYFNFSCFHTEWLLDSRSRIVYERKIMMDKQVFYVLPMEISGSCPSFRLAIQERFRGLCWCSIWYQGGCRWRKPLVVYQHVGPELVAWTLREMKKNPWRHTCQQRDMKLRPNLEEFR